MRVLLLPGPAVTADFFESPFGTPAQALSGQAGIGDSDDGITRSAPGDRVVDGMTTGGFNGLHHIHEGLAIATAQVEGEDLRCFREQAVQSGSVALSEIHYVDEATNTGAIGAWAGRGGAIPTEHQELWSAADGHLTHKREEDVGDAQRVFLKCGQTDGSQQV